MKLIYEKARYTVDDTLAIRTWTETDWGIEPYGDVTVNLSGYSKFPEEGCIFMPKYKMSDKYFDQVCSDIIEKVICPVQIGYGVGVYARLKPDWESLVEVIGK
jgi:hypothetical protein